MPSADTDACKIILSVLDSKGLLVFDTVWGPVTTLVQDASYSFLEQQFNKWWIGLGWQQPQRRIDECLKPSQWFTSYVTDTSPEAFASRVSVDLLAMRHAYETRPRGFGLMKN